MRTNTKVWVPGLLVGLLVVATGCASRGFVRNEVGTSSETLSERIAENETGLNTAQENIDAVANDLESTATELDEAQSNIEATRDELAETRTEVAEVRTIAENAVETADEANERSIDLVNRFGDRNRYNVEATQAFYFGFDSATLDPETSTDLEAVSQAIEDNPGAVVVLEGHTDSLGEENYNIQLAERRIDAVKRYLVVQLGVPVYRIHSFSYGEAEPPVPDADTENREQNRVVTLTILAPAGDTGTDTAQSFQD